MTLPVVTGQDLDQVIVALDLGQVVVVPTDTVYGLAARLDRPAALARIFEIKGRPAQLALPVLIGDTADIGAIALDWPPSAASLAERFWPGPLTIVANAPARVGRLVGGSGRTVGLRWPDDPVIQTLCHRVGPLAVTSANRHGEPPCTTPGAVTASFDGETLVSLVVDGGVCDGVPSTVVDCTVDPPRCLRPGSISAEAVASALG